ncbi:MAG: trehalose-phosphatase [Microbacterium sp.]|uniref:trehalose-phosphatase n=1 Tax=Microbacterium sp. TaxID=51671 RepID=UPI0039E5B7D7
MSADACVERLARTPRLLVALDFDGTLAPLADRPMTARMTPAAKDAVTALVATPDTAVALVSGRSLHDLREIAEHRLDSRLHLAASHGAEYWHPGDPAEPAPAADPAALRLRDELRARAEQVVADLEGVWIEPKAVGFALHTRLASDADTVAAHEAIGALMTAEAPDWRTRTGRDILEFASRHEGKDTAVAALRSLVDATAVLFAGDDVTDEDALRSLGPDDLGVRVGAGETAATLCVPDIAALASLLTDLADRRARAARE